MFDPMKKPRRQISERKIVAAVHRAWMKRIKAKIRRPSTRAEEIIASAISRTAEEFAIIDILKADCEIAGYPAVIVPGMASGLFCNVDGVRELTKAEYRAQGLV